jgi:hypothetical protein
MSDSESHNSDTEMAPPPAAKRPSSPSTSDRSSKSQRMQTEPKQEQQDENDDGNAQQAGSTLSATAPAFVPSAPSASAPKIPAKIEANVHKLIAAGLSDATINARLASTAATHGLRPYQFNKSQLALARANFEALKRGALGAKLGGNSDEATAAAGSSSSSTTMMGDTRPVKPIPAKPLSMRAGAKTYLPEQAKVPKTKEEKENSRRLIVVLSKVGQRRLDPILCSSQSSGHVT